MNPTGHVLVELLILYNSHNIQLEIRMSTDSFNAATSFPSAIHCGNKDAVEAIALGYRCCCCCQPSSTTMHHIIISLSCSPAPPPPVAPFMWMASKLLFYLNAKSCRVEKYANFWSASSPHRSLKTTNAKERRSRRSKRRTFRAQMFVRLADEAGNAIRINNSNFTGTTPIHSTPMSCLQTAGHHQQ